MIIAIELAMMTRMTKRVFIEVPDGYMDSDPPVPQPALNELMHEVYLLDEGMGFEIDDEWGCEEGTHHFIASTCVSDPDALFPDYRLKPDGEVELVEMGSDEETLTKLSDCLWPGGDKNNEWDSETLDFVARTLIESGWGPKK